MSAAMACCAAALISAGAEKSGKPCDRFTAPCFSASRVISRMTDSVNRSAFVESRAFCFGWCDVAVWGVAGFMMRSVEPPVNCGVARDDFDVFARLRERNRVHELGRLAILLAGVPLRHAVFTRIVRRERHLNAAELFLKLRQIIGAEPDIEIRI